MIDPSAPIDDWQLAPDRLTPDKLVLVIGVEMSVEPHPHFHFATQDSVSPLKAQRSLSRP